MFLAPEDESAFPAAADAKLEGSVEGIVMREVRVAKRFTRVGAFV